MTLYSLEKAMGSLEILIRLYVDGPTAKTELGRALRPSYETTCRTLTALEELKLVAKSTEAVFPYTQEYRLTDFGERLVESPLHRWPGLFWDHREDDGPSSGIRGRNEASRDMPPSATGPRNGPRSRK